MFAVLWTSMLLGTAVLLAGCAGGWVVGRYHHLLPVRAMAWWLGWIVEPMLESPSWLRRTATIFTNNTLVLAAVVGVGYWPAAGLVAIAILGFDVGIALRLLSLRPSEYPGREGQRPARAKRLIAAGTALNMLEPPAIVLSLGLALGGGAAALTTAQVWGTFGQWVVPALLIAAMGEALWLGAWYGHVARD